MQTIYLKLIFIKCHIIKEFVNNSISRYIIIIYQEMIRNSYTILRLETRWKWILLNLLNVQMFFKNPKNVQICTDLHDVLDLNNDRTLSVWDDECQHLEAWYSTSFYRIQFSGSVQFVGLYFKRFTRISIWSVCDFHHTDTWKLIFNKRQVIP